MRVPVLLIYKRQLLAKVPLSYPGIWWAMRNNKFPRSRAAGGRVAAEMVAPYPPGIPAIAPGEVVSQQLVDALREAAAGGTRLSYCADPKLATLQVVADRER